METNKNETTKIQNLLDRAKAVLKETRKISNSLTLHIKDLEKEDQTNPKLLKGNKK